MNISRVLLTVALGIFATMMAYGQDSPRKYTTSRPLVYEDLWDMAPYSYLDENGVPRGYNIDLVKIICERLDIPYVVKLYHSDEVFDDVAKRKADLTIGMYADYHFGRGAFSKSVITLFTQSIALSKKNNQVITDIEDLRNKKIYVRPSSFAYSVLLKSGLKSNIIPRVDLKAALMKVNETDSGIVLWNTMALKSIVNRYNLENIRISSVNMDHGEYRFLSKDTALLSKMDSVFLQLEMDDTVTQLRKKWFYPETMEDSSFKYVYYATTVVLFLLVCFLAYFFYFRYRERKMRTMLERQNQRLSLYLDSGKVRIFSYDLINRTFHAFRSFNDTNAEQQVYDASTFSQFFVDRDFAMMMKAINEISRHQHDITKMTVRLRRSKTSSQIFYFELNMSVLRKIEGEPSTILCTLCNLTDDMKKAEEMKNTLLKFRMMFDTAVIDMMYCDNDGYLIDINEKACATYGIKDKQKAIDHHFNMYKLRFACDIDLDTCDKHRSVCIADFDELKKEGIFSEIVTRRGKMYYDFSVVPIFGNNGERIGLFVTGKDISESVDFIHRDNLRTKRIQIATDRLKRYVRNINLALEVGNIRLAHYSPTTRSFDLVYDLNRPSMVLSQLRCVRSLDPSSRPQAESMLLNMDRCRQKRFSLRVKTNMKNPSTGNTLYYQVSGVPIEGKDGNTQQYFCLLRNITELVATEEALKEKTKKAQEAEILKNNFLKNMSHEIRTPLNAVVGFAELFEQDHSVDDEVVFSNEIKTNSKKLLYLINDILLLSRIDAKMIEINKEPVDVIDTFKTRCLMAWSSGLSDKVHTAVECQFDKLVVNVDITQVGYIVETLSRMAAKFTEKGNIRTKLDYFNDELVLKFEDTGRGIDDEVQKHIFDVESRFEGGQDTSGLELVIVNKIVKLMGGNIYVESQLGRGSTFRVTLPCEVTEKEKSEGTNTMDFTYR